MAHKERVDIKRSDQFQEMDEALTEAMAVLDSTIDRVSAIFHSEEPSPRQGENGDEDPAATVDVDAEGVSGTPGNPPGRQDKKPSESA